MLLVRGNILFVLLFLLPLQVFAEQQIKTILIEGNEVTEEQIIRLEMIIREGDPVDVGKIEKSVQYVKDIGLFEWVNYRLEKDATTNDVTLVLTVKERFYLIPLPTFRLNSDSQLEYGIKVRWDNIWGRNHRLNWKVLDKGATEGIKEFSNEVDYTMPRLFLSRYQLTLRTQNSKDVDEDPDFGFQLQKSWSAGFELQKWLNDNGISRGLFAAGGIHFGSQEIIPLDPSSGNAEIIDAIIYGARLGMEERHEYEFNEGGKFLQYQVSFSLDDQPSQNDSSFVKHEIEYISQNSFSQYPPVNFNYKIVIGSSNDDVLGDKAFALGGNTNLRGYKTDTYRGNSVLRGNFEYLSKLSESSLLRKLFFIDTGAVPEKLTDLKLTDFKSSAGFGIRWKLRQFVRLDLRLDAAYAFETDEFRMSLGAKSTF